MKSSSYCFSDILSLQRNNNQNSREKRRCRQTQSLMALRMWASSTANALKVSSASRPHLLHPFSFSRCLSSGIYSHTHTRYLFYKHTKIIIYEYEYHLHISLYFSYLFACGSRGLIYLFCSHLFACFAVLDGLKYADSHEWVKHEGSVATIGITDHAQVGCLHLFLSENLFLYEFIVYRHRVIHVIDLTLVRQDCILFLFSLLTQ